MPEILLLDVANRVVGEKHHRVVSRHAPHGVVHVDPRIHSLISGEVPTRRPELDGHQRLRLLQPLQYGIHGKRVWGWHGEST